MFTGYEACTGNGAVMYIFTTSIHYFLDTGDG